MLLKYVFVQFNLNKIILYSEQSIQISLYKVIIPIQVVNVPPPIIMKMKLAHIYNCTELSKKAVMLCTYQTLILFQHLHFPVVFFFFFCLFLHVQLLDFSLLLITRLTIKFSTIRINSGLIQQLTNCIKCANLNSNQITFGPYQFTHPFRIKKNISINCQLLLNI